MARSAGSYVKILSSDGNNIHLQLPSSEVRMVNEKCFATIGTVSNPDHKYRDIGKAGINRKRGKRPHVRGSAMNPVDHPHGGGEGRTGIGLKHPKTPWGKIALGPKTRSKKRWTNKFIIRRRKKK
jgi:large subunit ribosomal protein L2